MNGKQLPSRQSCRNYNFYCCGFCISLVWNREYCIPISIKGHYERVTGTKSPQRQFAVHALLKSCSCLKLSHEA